MTSYCCSSPKIETVCFISKEEGYSPKKYMYVDIKVICSSCDKMKEQREARVHKSDRLRDICAKYGAQRIVREKRNAEKISYTPQKADKATL